MARRLATLIAHDARLQFRYGIYFAYAFVLAFYIIVLLYAGPYLPAWLPALIIFTDPAVLGFFFLGALMMLEKAEDARSALAITPISAADYFWAKTTTLTTMALIAVAILTPFLHEAVNWPMLFAIVALTSIHFIGIGVLTAFYFKTVTSYLIGAAGFLIPIIAPGFIALMDPMPLWAILIPSVSQFKLILIATGATSANAGEIAAMFIIALLAALGTVWLAIRSLKKELGSK